MSKSLWTTVKVCTHTFDAQMIKSILESEEIPVRMLNENMNNLFPDTGLVDIKMQVPEEFQAEAKKIIEEFSEDE